LSQAIVPSSLGFDVLDDQDNLNVANRNLTPEKLNNLITFKCGFGGVNAAIALRKEGSF
jgi:3-oxoacyl-(acyl-carrier-protein) synthase